MSVKTFETMHKPLAKSVAALLSFLFFYFLYAPLTTSNTLYRDDNIRNHSGYLFWVAEGRIFSKLSVNILAFSDGAYLSPFPQLIAVALMAGVTLWAAQKIFGSISLYSLSLISLVFLNPFYLQNMSYSYDSLPMTLASCCAVIAAVTLIQPLRYVWILVICFGYILYSYQPALGLYVSVTLLIVFKNFIDHKLRFRSIFLAKTLIYFGCVALLLWIYKLSFTSFFPDATGRTYLSLRKLWPNILHLNNDLRLVFYPNFSTVLYIISALVCLSLLAMAFKTSKNPLKAFSLWIWSMGVALAAFALILLNAEGPSILLSYEPYAERLLIGASGLWLLALYIISTMSKGLFAGLYMAFTLLCFSFSYTYGAFLRLQNEHNAMLLTNIHYDITHNPLLRKNQGLIVQNALPLAPINMPSLKKTPLIASIYGEQHLFWLSNGKVHPFLIKASSDSPEHICSLIKEMKKSPDTQTVISTSDYALYSYKNFTFIDFYTDQDLYDHCGFRGI